MDPRLQGQWSSTRGPSLRSGEKDMADFIPEQSQEPTQAIEKPPSTLPPSLPLRRTGRSEGRAAVWVFGVLNCLFGGLGMLFTFVEVGFLSAVKFIEVETPDENKIKFLFESAIWFCMSVWQVGMGIGLLKLKKWARRGSIIYACVDIAWTLLVIVIDIITELLHLVNRTGADNWYKSVEGMCLNLIGLIFPTLLLIFMRSAKVKEAFSAVGG